MSTVNQKCYEHSKQRTLSLGPKSYEYPKTNVLQMWLAQCPWDQYEITLGHKISNMR
jgi:hypothetical protein